MPLKLAYVVKLLETTALPAIVAWFRARKLDMSGSLDFRDARTTRTPQVSRLASSYSGHRLSPSMEDAAAEGSAEVSESMRVWDGMHPCFPLQLRQHSASWIKRGRVLVAKRTHGTAKKVVFYCFLWD